MTAYTHVPNSYQKPNVFADQIMRLLSPTQNMVLDAACRKIMGWETRRITRRDRISLSQFQELTGLSINAIRAALAHLSTGNLLTPIGEPVGRIAQEYELNLGQRGDYRWEFLRDHAPARWNPEQARAAKQTQDVAVPSLLPTNTHGEEYPILKGPLSLSPANELAYYPLTTQNSLNSKRELTIDSLWLQAQALARNLLPRATFDAHLAAARLEAGEAPGTFRLVLAYCEGPNARAWLKSHLEPTLLYALSKFTDPVVALDYGFPQGDSHDP